MFLSSLSRTNTKRRRNYEGAQKFRNLQTKMYKEKVDVVGLNSTRWQNIFNSFCCVEFELYVPTLDTKKKVEHKRTRKSIALKFWVRMWRLSPVWLF